MSESCEIADLRTLFLFEHLSDAQLETLCALGRVETFPAGPLIREGEPATHFYVMFDGELVMSGRLGGLDIQTQHTTQRGVYCGAWSAYIPEPPEFYDVSIRLLRPSRFFVLTADEFGDFMRTQFPMAVHLLTGHTLGTLRQQQLLGQRARLLALGNITAGLTHQLNNPAAAIVRAAADLHDGSSLMRHRLAALAHTRFTGPTMDSLVAVHDEVATHVGESRDRGLSALEASDLEDRIGDWLDDRGVADAWEVAPTFAEAGLEVGWMDGVAESVGALTADAGSAEAVQRAVAWLSCAVDTELRMREIIEAGKRISALLDSAKQYSQMDRGLYQLVDVHDLLQSTLTMFDGRVGPGSGIALATDWDRSLPQITCYAGDLNQVWTNLIVNAVEALSGGGTLTIRTACDGDTMIRVEVCDDGPGIAADVIDQVFTPFFSTKPVGEGSGLGLDLAWRVVDRHGGSITVHSVPGDTRFIVSLPIEAPGPQ